MVFQDARPLRALHEQVVGTLAHELRTPLSVARAMVQLARKEVTGQRSVALLTRAMERMDECARIISDVFVFAEYQRQGRLPLAPEDVELGALCGRVVADQTLLNPLRSVRLVPPDSLRVCVDPHRVEQAVSNLVANALHHGAGEVVVRLSRAGEGAEIRVENPGEDIPPEVLARFFEPFERGALPAGRHEAQGLGLGLYIAQAIARAHGGSVRAESGNGLVVFTLVLPVEGLPP